MRSQKCRQSSETVQASAETVFRGGFEAVDQHSGCVPRWLPTLGIDGGAKQVDGSHANHTARRGGRGVGYAGVRFPDLILPGADDLIMVRDPRDMDGRSRVTRRLPSDLSPVHYRLRDRSLFAAEFAEPIAVHSRLNLGDLHLTRIVDRFGTAMEIGGPGLPRYWFGLVNAGAVEVHQGAHAAVLSGAIGSALRGLSGTGSLSSDDSVRTSLWVEADALERALSLLIDAPAGSIAFRPVVDWSSGLAESLLGLTDYLAADMRSPNGLASNGIASATFSDLVLRTILVGLPHDRSGHLARIGDASAPAYVRRAEEYMRTHADRPLRMAEIAAAAGCSLRTLDAGFARYRGATPLAVLRALRLDRAREALQRNGEVPIGDVAWRFGFTNAGRFAAAYARRFGEHPSDTVRLRLRGR